MPYAFVVPEEAVKKYGKDFREHPVGTGPFQFKLWDEGNALVFHKNPNYWKKDAQGNQLPYLDAVHISFITDKKMEFINFQQKKLDFLSGIKEGTRDIILQPMALATRFCRQIHGAESTLSEYRIHWLSADKTNLKRSR
jgi:peptide/nickel transport system substrate-binding protein